MKISRTEARSVLNEERAYAAALNEGLWTDPAPEYQQLGVAANLFFGSPPNRLKRVVSIVKESLGTPEIRATGVLAEASAYSREYGAKAIHGNIDMSTRLIARLSEIANSHQQIISEVAGHAGPTIFDVTGVDVGKLEITRRVFEALASSIGGPDEVQFIIPLRRAIRAIGMIGEGQLHIGDDASFRAYTTMVNEGILWSGKPVSRARYIGSRTQRITERALQSALMLHAMWPGLSKLSGSLKRALVKV